MNATDRKELKALHEKLQDLGAQAENIGSDLRALAEAEREKYDNMPEGLQDSDQGQAIEAAADALEEAADAADTGNVGEAAEALDGLDL